MKKIIIVNGTNMSDEQKAKTVAKYLRTHKLHVQFAGAVEYEFAEEFNLEYACTCLCHISIVDYAKSFGFYIPDTIHNRKSLSHKIEALRELIGGVVDKEVDVKLSKPATEDAKAPIKEDFTSLLDDEPYVPTEEDERELQAIEGVQIIEGEKQIKQLKVELETKVITEPVDAAKEAPADLKCPHCNATARTPKSYLKNHGDNCARKIETK